jgi:hypothetical protein
MKRLARLLTWPIRKPIGYLRFKLRVRAMKRRDPFIY